MPARRALVLLALTLLALESTACATILRPSRADLVFKNAPENLQVLDEEGAPLTMQKQSDGSVGSQVTYKTRSVTVTSGNQSAKVELETTTSVGYVIVDLLLYLFPAVIDFATSKWTNFGEVDVRAAFAKAKNQPPAPAPQPRPAKQVASAKPGPLIQPAQAQQRGWLEPARADPPLIQPATHPQTLVQPAPAPQRRAPVVSSGKLAVLDFRSYADALKPEDVRYFTDLVRGATLRASPDLQVMTRENLLVRLQATGKDAANCEGECEVDTGRRIGADAVISGEILKVGSHFKLSLKLHETRDGRLLSTAVASGRNVDELDESAQAAVIDLISPQR